MPCQARLSGSEQTVLAWSDVAAGAGVGPVLSLPLAAALVIRLTRAVSICRLIAPGLTSSHTS